MKYQQELESSTSTLQLHFESRVSINNREADPIMFSGQTPEISLIPKVCMNESDSVSLMIHVRYVD